MIKDLRNNIIEFANERYLCAFTFEEFEEIQGALKQKGLVDEISRLLKEQNDRERGHIDIRSI